MLSTLDIAKKLNKSIGCIRYCILKKIVCPSKNTNNHYIFTENDEEKIKNWLNRKKSNYDFTLLGTTFDGELAKLWGITRERVRQLRTKRKIEKYKKPKKILIKLTKTVKYEHSLRNYKRGCSCEICKLANRICTFCCKHYGKSYKNFSDGMANKYLNEYIEDKTRYKRNFYKIIDTEYKSFVDFTPLP